MQKGTDVEFKSLLTEKEYNKLLEYFTNAKSDFQTNHYFDTKRFSLKALNASLRVRERENFELTLKRKKGYNTDLKSITISLYVKIYETTLKQSKITTIKIDNILTFKDIFKIINLLNNYGLKTLVQN